MVPERHERQRTLTARMMRYVTIVLTMGTCATSPSPAGADELMLRPPVPVALEAATDLSPVVSTAMDLAAREATAASTLDLPPVTPWPTDAGQATDDEPFPRGTRHWSVTTGASRDASLGVMSFTQIHLHRYVARRLALLYGGMFGYVNTNRTPAGVFGGPNVGLRWQWLAGERWSTYLEGLVGVLLQTQPFTENSLRFNFDLQPGTGASYRVNDRTFVQGGFRWHHLSNARVAGREHNFGYDAPMVYLELMKAF